MSVKPGQTYYDILEVAGNATQEEVHKAFLKAKNTYSSNNPAIYSVFSEDEAIAFLRLIDEAYAVLGHADRRKIYDKKIEDGNVATASENKSEPTPVKVDSNFKKDPQLESEIASQESFDGNYIRKVRDYKNVSIEEMSKITRIGRQYLVALENNEFEKLPAPVFVRGFVVQVSKTLGLEPKKVADSYMELFKSNRD